MADPGDKAASLVARLASLPFSGWHRTLLAVGLETRGLALEQITGATPVPRRA
ncbi:MAG: hypothetical protein ACLQJR_12450 [Stellaceae bacterium]